SSTTDDRGEYRLFLITPGRYYVSALPAPAGLDRSDNVVTEPGYARTYYPGSADMSGASAIDLQDGAELRTIDFTLVRQKQFRVGGRVVDAQAGKPNELINVEIRSRDPRAYLAYGGNARYNPTDGTFELKDVPPGSYWVSAMQLEASSIGAI